MIAPFLSFHGQKPSSGEPVWTIFGSGMQLGPVPDQLYVIGGRDNNQAWVMFASTPIPLQGSLGSGRFHFHRILKRLLWFGRCHCGFEQEPLDVVEMFDAWNGRWLQVMVFIFDIFCKTTVLVTACGSLLGGSPAPRCWQEEQARYKNWEEHGWSGKDFADDFRDQLCAAGCAAAALPNGCLMVCGGVVHLRQLGQ